MTVSFKENRLTIDGETVELEKPIRQIVEFDNRIIVLFNPDVYTGEEPEIDRNVVAVGGSVRLLPRSQKTDQSGSPTVITNPVA